MSFNYPKNIKLYISGYTLISSLICSVLGILILGSIIHFLYFYVSQTEKLYFKMQVQQEKLIAQHYLINDIRNAGFNINTTKNTLNLIHCKANEAECKKHVNNSVITRIHSADIKPLSDILILHSVVDRLEWQHNQEVPELQIYSNTVMYYIRQSIIPGDKFKHSYTLYRDDTQHAATALIENITNLRINIERNNTVSIVYLTLYLTNAEQVTIVCANRNFN